MNLIPCPHCGSEDVNILHTHIKYFSECNNCGAKSDLFDSPKEAAEAWNRRTAVLPEMTLGQAIKLSNEFTPRQYSFAAYFLAGYNHARKLLEGNKP